MEPFPYASIRINYKHHCLLTHRCKLYVLWRIRAEGAECDVSVKGNGIWPEEELSVLTHAATRVDLENVILSGRSQAPKVTCRKIPCV